MQQAGCGGHRRRMDEYLRMGREPQETGSDHRQDFQPGARLARRNGLCQPRASSFVVGMIRTRRGQQDIDVRRHESAASNSERLRVTRLRRWPALLLRFSIPRDPPAQFRSMSLQGVRRFHGGGPCHFIGAIQREAAPKEKGAACAAP